jgi:hypothetical protein
MSHKTANNALMHPFSVLRRIGFSSRVMQRLERYRSQQDKQGRVVSVLSWADGTWCALNVGGKVWAAYRLIDLDQIGLMKLVLPEQGENFGDWKFGELANRSHRHTVQDVLAM